MKKTAILILLLMSAVFAREVPQLSIDFTFVPDNIYPGEKTIGVFNIVNPQGARPVFDLDLTFWAPCNYGIYNDFFDITEWNINNPSWKGTRVLFSGVIERREVLGEDLNGNPQTYAQCLYSFVFQLPPKADNFRGPAVIRPGEEINLNFTLQSSPYARPGVYNEELISQDYVLPGKELATVIKK
jgi:hypothetical protein